MQERGLGVQIQQQVLHRVQPALVGRMNMAMRCRCSSGPGRGSTGAVQRTAGHILLLLLHLRLRGLMSQQ
jgi:hypothetical protein